MEYSYNVTIRYSGLEWKDTVRGGTVGEAMETACGRFERAMRGARHSIEITGITVDRA